MPSPLSLSFSPHSLLRFLRAEGPEALAGALGFGGPVALGLATGHIGAGLAGATGALMAGGGSETHGPRKASTVLPVLAAPLMATFLAQSIVGRGWQTGAVVTGLVFLAALIGGFSRPMAMATTRFSVFLLITLNVAGGEVGGVHAGGVMLMIGAGLAWATMLNRLARRLTPAGPEVVDTDEEPRKPQAPFNRRLAYYLRGLKTLGGWSFALRVGLALAAAETAAVIWPDQHLHWIALTVVLLSARKPEPGQGKIRDRAIGTALGVAIAGLLLLWRPPPWGLVAGVMTIAGVRPLLRTRSYMAYSVAMTPLIILLQDFTTPPHIGLLADRIGATLAGAILVMAGARLFPPRPAGARRERSAA